MQWRSPRLIFGWAEGPFARRAQPQVLLLVGKLCSISMAGTTRASRAEDRDKKKLICEREVCSFYHNGTGFCSKCSTDWEIFDGPPRAFRKSIPSVDLWLKTYLKSKQRPSRDALHAVRFVCSRTVDPSQIYTTLRAICCNGMGELVVYPLTADLLPLLPDISQFISSDTKQKAIFAILSFCIDYYNIPTDLPTTYCYLGDFGEKPKSIEYLLRKVRTNLHFVAGQLGLPNDLHLLSS